MVEVNVMEVFVEMDSIGGMSCGCGEVKHDVRYGTGARVKDAKTACI